MTATTLNLPIDLKKDSSAYKYSNTINYVTNFYMDEQTLNFLAQN